MAPPQLQPWHDDAKASMAPYDWAGTIPLLERDIVEHPLPLELGDLPYEGGIIEEVLGKPGLALLGKKVWEREVLFCIEQLKLSFIADYVMLGGENAKILDELPDGAELGHNRNAYLGGVRMWETEPRTKRPKWNVI